MNMTLTVVVSAIVILITALVVITIFGTGITQVTTISQAKAICATQMQSTCSWSHTDPTSWGAENLRVGDDVVSCGGVLPSCDCVASGDVWAPSAGCSG